jgi:glyoxylase-like metal-dependent hydrolase (beta-lactamase superfamily II)
MKLYSIPTGNFKLDGGAMFGVVPKVLWEKQYPSDEHNLCSWAMRCLLVETDDGKRILIDNGIGDKQDEKFMGHYYLHGDDSLEKSLSRYGFSFEDITDVVLSHLHFDHCGGSVKKDKQTGELSIAFPNANYWTTKAQWEWAVNPNDREKASFLKENILPIQESGHLRFIDASTNDYLHMDLRVFNGHTAGQIIPIIPFEGKKLVFMADLLPSTVHIPIPWVMSYDTRPLLTLEEKKPFLEEACENDYILFFEHDIYNECCSLQMTPKGVRVKETFTLEEFTKIKVL